MFGNSLAEVPIRRALGQLEPFREFSSGGFLIYEAPNELYTECTFAGQTLTQLINISTGLCGTTKPGPSDPASVPPCLSNAEMCGLLTQLAAQSTQRLPHPPPSIAPSTPPVPGQAEIPTLPTVPLPSLPGGAPSPFGPSFEPLQTTTSPAAPYGTAPRKYPTVSISPSGMPSPSKVIAPPVSEIPAAARAIGEAWAFIHHYAETTGITLYLNEGDAQVAASRWLETAVPNVPDAAAQDEILAALEQGDVRSATEAWSRWKSKTAGRPEFVTWERRAVYAT